MSAAIFLAGVLLGVLLGGIAGFVYRSNYALDDWREDYLDWKRAWDDWERAKARASEPQTGSNDE